MKRPLPEVMLDVCFATIMGAATLVLVVFLALCVWAMFATLPAAK